jgi:hypothetical protein
MHAEEIAKKLCEWSQLAFDGKHLDPSKDCGIMEYSQDGDALLLAF